MEVRENKIKRSRGQKEGGRLKAGKKTGWAEEQSGEYLVKGHN